MVQRQRRSNRRPTLVLGGSFGVALIIVGSGLGLRSLQVPPEAAAPPPEVHQLVLTYTGVAAGTSIAYPEGAVGPIGPPRRSDEVAFGGGDALEVAEQVDEAGEDVQHPALYTNLLTTLELELELGRSPAAFGGSVEPVEAGLRIELVTPEGWRETTHLVPTTPMADGETISAQLELDAFTGRVVELAELTGIGPSGYRIDVTPSIVVPELGERPGNTFSFDVGPSVIAPSGEMSTTWATAASATPLTPEVAVPAGGLDPDRARASAVVAIIVGIMLLALVGRRLWALDPSRYGRLLYRSRLVELDRVPHATHVTSVERLSQLARLASKEDKPLFAAPSPRGGYRFLVLDGPRAFIFEPPRRAGATGRDDVVRRSRTTAGRAVGVSSGRGSRVEPTGDDVETMVDDGWSAWLRSGDGRGAAARDEVAAR